MKAQDSPRTSPSPPPLPGIQLETEQELLALANALYNLGTTVITDSTKDRPKQSPDSNHIEGKPVGQRVNEVVDRLAAIETLSQKTISMIPMQIIQDVDNSKNPMMLTKDRLERAATENQFINGKIHALSTYSSLLAEALKDEFQIE